MALWTMRGWHEQQFIWALLLSLASVARCRGKTVGVAQGVDEDSSGYSEKGSGYSEEGSGDSKEGSSGIDSNTLLLIATSSCAAVFLLSVAYMIVKWPKNADSPPMSPKESSVKASLPVIAMRIATEEESSGDL